MTDEKQEKQMTRRETQDWLSGFIRWHAESDKRPTTATEVAQCARIAMRAIAIQERLEGYYARKDIAYICEQMARAQEELRKALTHIGGLADRAPHMSEDAIILSHREVQYAVNDASRVIEHYLPAISAVVDILFNKSTEVTP